MGVDKFAIKGVQKSTDFKHVICKLSLVCLRFGGRYHHGVLLHVGPVKELRVENLHHVDLALTGLQNLGLRGRYLYEVRPGQGVKVVYRSK